ncbi:MAG: hypothetical protein JSW11_00935 [Candidatus Heimdallarchaeota archaeon]|nr:MAG: hypothetical protein JSW11_00935 [Candidatus Heimdallarchaeota archaeon]
MNQKLATAKLKQILNKEDSQTDGLINRKPLDNENELEVLIQNIAILVAYLRFEVEATRRELFSARKLLEQ